MDPLRYFSFQPVLHNWCNKGCGMCYPVCGVVHIKELLKPIGKSSPCSSNRFWNLFSKSEFDKSSFDSVCLKCTNSGNVSLTVYDALNTLFFSHFYKGIENIFMRKKKLHPKVLIYMQFNLCHVVYRAFAHGVMGRRIDRSWGGPIELFLVPASAPRLVQ